MLRDAPLFSVANHKFNVIVLAAGMGQRLHPVTDHIPKALVDLGKGRAIDYVIRKYQYVADRVIVATGYCADLLENYVRGKYQSLSVCISREAVADLTGPGMSFLYALDYASSRLPTIVTFCDIIFGDVFSVETNALVLCRPDDSEAVIDTYRHVALVEDGVVSDIVLNEQPDVVRENGFTGTAICHNTMLLKSIAYGRATATNSRDGIDYTLDVMRTYVREVRTMAAPVSQLFEFGTEQALASTRNYFDAAS